MVYFISALAALLAFISATQEDYLSFVGYTVWAVAEFELRKFSPNRKDRITKKEYIKITKVIVVAFVLIAAGSYLSGDTFIAGCYMISAVALGVLTIVKKT